MTCSRIIIINRGRIEACDTPENLLNQMRTATGVVLEAKTGNDNGIEELKKIAGVKDVSLTNDDDWQIFSLRAEAGADVRPEVFRWRVSAAGRCASCRSAKRRSKTSSWRSRMRMKRDKYEAHSDCHSERSEVEGIRGELDSVCGVPKSRCKASK
jgi:ABC-type multidrug transport system ATPase subunit